MLDSTGPAACVYALDGGLMTVSVGKRRDNSVLELKAIGALHVG